MTGENIVANRQILKNGSVMITLVAELSYGATALLSNVLEQEFSRNNFRIIFDFQNINVIGSVHLGILWQGCQTARNKGGDILFCHLNETVMEAFERIGLEQMVKIINDPDLPH